MTLMTKHENNFSLIGQSVPISRHGYRNVTHGGLLFLVKSCRVKGAEGWNDLSRGLLLTMRAK